MKRIFLYPLISVLVIVLYSFISEQKQFVEYHGGRMGFSGVSLKLFNDSTYSYSEWNHTGRSIIDNGKWGRVNEKYFLNSSSMTRWKTRKGKSDKIYRFQSQEIVFTGDTLKFIPINDEEKDYYDDYYRLFRVTDFKK